jgi:deoxyribodipyrimidine photo-lyase
MSDKPEIAICWFRRDLRADDNMALWQALNCGLPVLPVFIFDRNILDKLEDRADARVNFIHRQLSGLNHQFAAWGSGIMVLSGNPSFVWKELCHRFNVKAVYANHDYEPYARERDSAIGDFLSSQGIAFHTFKDQVVFEKAEVVKDDGNPYTVFTPYSRKWKALLQAYPLRILPSETKLSALIRDVDFIFPSLEAIGFQAVNLEIPDAQVSDVLLSNYGQLRDIPSVSGTSRLSVHLRFGTISIRKLVQQALANSEKYLNELIWREFYMQILWHFPHVAGRAFKPVYDRIPWVNDENAFQCWKEGRTGFPMVDAGMRELAATGFMHNRVRMVTAAFLTKNLLTDWRWGEAWFAEKLLDFELSSNNGGWQWAAGSGVDAAPYFRVFNPDLQVQKFDPQFKYIRRWVPEFGTPLYPRPIIDYAWSRKRCLEVYREALAE